MGNKKEPELEPGPKQGEEGEDQFPTDTAVLRADLQAFGVRAPARVASYLAQGNLEDAYWLDRGLADMNVDVNVRKPFIKYWVNKKGSAIPKELERKLSPEVTIEEERAREKLEMAKSKYSVDEESGAIKVATTSEKALTWDEARELSKSIKKEIAERGGKKAVTYVYDTETGQVRMAKEGEMGGTLEQAKELKRMAEESRKGTEEVESPFIMDEQGNWMLNPKARVTGVELMALEAIRRSQEKGEPVDPLEALSQAAERMRVYQEALGGAGRQLPEWMTDPTKFIETVHTISGEGKADEGLRSEIAELRTTLKEMQEQRHREELASLQVQIRQQAEAHQQQMDTLMDRVEEMSKPVTGRSEMDIIHEVATGVLDEIKGARGDVKSFVLSQGLPQPKTPEQRELRKQRYRAALAADEEFEQLGKRLFFGEGTQSPQPE